MNEGEHQSPGLCILALPPRRATWLFRLGPPPLGPRAGFLHPEPTSTSETLPASMGGGRARVSRLEGKRAVPRPPRPHIQAPPHNALPSLSAPPCPAPGLRPRPSLLPIRPQSQAPPKCFLGSRLRPYSSDPALIPPIRPHAGSLPVCSSGSRRRP